MDALDTILEHRHHQRRLPPPEVRRTLRLAAGLSLADIAIVVGVTVGAVSRWESPGRTPSRGDNARRYAEVLQRLALEGMKADAR